jgi:hypothetical protein
MVLRRFQLLLLSLTSLSFYVPHATYFIIVIVVIVVVVVNNSLFVQILWTEDFSDMALRMRIVATFIIVDLQISYVICRGV